MSSLPPAPKKIRKSGVNQSFESSVYCEDDADSPYNMYFVRIPLHDPDAPTEQELKIHEELFKSLTKNGVDPIWIDVPDVFKLRQKDDYFVLPIFRGNCFRRMCEEDFRVYGPPIVAECLEEQKALPSWDHPVYSSVFEGTTLCITSVNSELKDKLYKVISWMNGNAAKSLFENTTHLIVGKANTESEKYKVATRNNIKLMKVDWVEELWEKTQTMLGKFSANSPDVVTAYRLRVFEGVEMTVTKLEGPDRANLMKLIEEHGGKVSGLMVKRTCTHLVTDQMSGEKYKKATEWKTIKIVQMRWIRKCIDLGYLVEEAKYHPKYLSVEHLRSSTPQKDLTVNESVPDVSSIAGHGGRLSISANTSSMLTPSSVNTMEKMTRIFERPNSTSVVSATILEQNETINVQSTSRFVTTKSNSNLTLVVNDPIDELLLRTDEDSDFLEGCMIWLCGVEDSKMDKWRRVLDRSGATRVQKIDSATHVVVVSANQSEKTIIRKYMSQPDIVIVTAPWIVECFKQKALVSHEEFEWNENVFDETMNPSTQNESKRRSSGISRNSSVDCTSLSRYSEDPPTQMKGIFAPIKFFIHSTLNGSIAARTSIKIEKNGGRIVEDADSADYVIFGHSERMDVLISFDTTITYLYIDVCLANEELIDISSHPLFVPLPQPITSLFSQNSFILFTSNEILKKYTHELIESNGGKVLEKTDPLREKAYYIVMEQLDMNSVDQRQRNRMIDLSWIVASISTGRRRSPNDHLFSGEPLKDYERQDDAWVKCTKDKEQTVVMDKNFEERLDLESNSSMSEMGSREREVIGNKYRTDLTKPFKMRLKLDGVNDIINDIPSPSQVSDDTMTTSRIGDILKKAVVNTGRRDVPPVTNNDGRMKPPMGIYENSNSVQKSPVAVSNRKSISSTAMLFSSNKRDHDQEPSYMEATMRRGKENTITAESLQNKKDDFVQRHFVLSCSDLPQETRHQLRVDIVSLGGIVTDEYFKEATHLICAKMSRTPKILSAIAAGKWCLVLDYVTESKKYGKWLQEEDYEWNELLLPREAKPVELKLSQYCRIWREKISEAKDKKKCGAFNGWRCVIHRNDKRTLSVHSILEAGGATVSVINDYIEVIPLAPTHVFASKDFDWNVQSAAMLKRACIPLISFEFIYEFLVNEVLEGARFYHASFKKC